MGDLIKDVEKYGIPFLSIFGFEPDIHGKLKQSFLDKFSYLPVVIHRIDLHSLYLSKKAREKLCNLTGKEYPFLCKGKNNEEVLKIIRKSIPEEVIKKAVDLAERRLIKYGVTTAVSLVDDEATFPVETEILLNRDSIVDFVVFPQVYDIKQTKKLGLKRIGGCFLIDGSFGSKTAALSFNYKNSNNKGRLYIKGKNLRNFIYNAYSNGLQTAFHAIGDRAIDEVLTAYEFVIPPNNPLRMRIEHAELLRDNLIRRIEEGNIVLSMQPSFEYFWGGKKGMYAERIGDKYKYTNPFSKLLKKNIVVAGGSDAPITPPDPVLGIKAAVNRERWRITLEQAIKMFTENAAYSVFQEGIKGKIEKGYIADVIVMDKEMKIKKVYKRGVKVFERKDDER